jgi:hypothetical protein
VYYKLKLVKKTIIIYILFCYIICQLSNLRWKKLINHLNFKLQKVINILKNDYNLII